MVVPLHTFVAPYVYNLYLGAGAMIPKDEPPMPPPPEEPDEPDVIHEQNEDTSAEVASHSSGTKLPDNIKPMKTQCLLLNCCL